MTNTNCTNYTNFLYFSQRIIFFLNINYHKLTINYHKLIFLFNKLFVRFAFVFKNKYGVVSACAVNSPRIQVTLLEHSRRKPH